MGRGVGGNVHIQAGSMQIGRYLHIKCAREGGDMERDLYIIHI